PCEAEIRLDRRAVGDDVPRHEVRVRRIRLDGDDFDLLRHGGFSIQHVRELRAQHADLAVRAFRAIELETLGSYERALLLAADLPPAFLPERPVPPACGLSAGSSWP